MFEWMFRHREMVAERFRHIQAQFAIVVSKIANV